MHTRGLRRALVSAVIAAAAVSVGGAAAAQPAGKAGWHIAAVLRHCANDSLESVAAVGPDDAWAIGAPNWPGPSCDIDLEHWDGAHWRRVRTPRGVGLGSGTELSFPIAATSSTDAWIFPGLLTNIGDSFFTYNYSLRWNGNAWLRSGLPAKPIITAAAAFGPRNAWAFGFRYRRAGAAVPYAARYAKSAWREVTMPGAALAVSAVSARDLWAIGPTIRTASRRLARQSWIAMAWNGHAWRAVRAPRPRLAGAGSYLEDTYIAAVGPRDVWWSYNVAAGIRDSSGLLHWNGTGWQHIAVPATMGDVTAISQDGAGGVWLTDGARWYHYRDGRWTSQRVLTPRKYNDTMFGLAWIPHTTSLWSVGEADLNFGTPSVGATVGVIARYRG